MGWTAAHNARLWGVGGVKSQGMSGSRQACVCCRAFLTLLLVLLRPSHNPKKNRQLPFDDIDISWDKKFTYLDTQGRPVLVLRKDNVVPGVWLGCACGCLHVCVGGGGDEGTTWSKVRLCVCGHIGYRQGVTRVTQGGGKRLCGCETCTPLALTSLEDASLRCAAPSVRLHAFNQEWCAPLHAGCILTQCACGVVCASLPVFFV